MKKMVFLGLILALISCGKPSAEIIQTAIAQTAVMNQNATQTSYSQTQAAIPTNTQIPTNTPKPTFTPTPIYTQTPTRTPIPPRLITATVVQATKQYVAGFTSIPWKELKGYPDNHEGEKIKITGRVFQIVDDESLMLWFPGTYDAFYAVFDTSFTGIYEDQSITMYGTVEGEFCYNTRAGGTNCVPEINVLWYTKK